MRPHLLLLLPSADHRTNQPLPQVQFYLGFHGTNLPKLPSQRAGEDLLLLLLLLLLLQVAKYKNSLEHKIRVSNVLSHPDLAHFRAALTGAAGEVEAPPSALPLVLLMLLLL